MDILQQRKQRVFNKVYRHLMKQKRASLHMLGTCAYRGSDGTMCAVGCLIQNRYYKQSLEGSRAGAAAVVQALRASRILTKDEARVCITESPNPPTMITFLEDLQQVHDSHTPDEWKSLLDAIAKEHRLAVPRMRGVRA